MLSRAFLKSSASTSRISLTNNSRTYASSTITTRSIRRRPLRAIALASAGLVGASALSLSLAPASDPAEPPLHELARTYVVYTLCAVPGLVDIAPKLLNTLLTVPLVRIPAEAVVRATFFDQFVGGDTAEGCVPLLRRLRAAGKGALLVYSSTLR